VIKNNFTESVERKEKEDRGDQVNAAAKGDICEKMPARENTKEGPCRVRPPARLGPPGMTRGKGFEPYSIMNFRKRRRARQGGRLQRGKTQHKVWLPPRSVCHSGSDISRWPTYRKKMMAPPNHLQGERPQGMQGGGPCRRWLLSTRKSVCGVGRSAHKRFSEQLSRSAGKN